MQGYPFDSHMDGWVPILPHIVGRVTPLPHSTTEVIGNHLISTTLIWSHGRVGIKDNPGFHHLAGTPLQGRMGDFQDL